MSKLARAKIDKLLRLSPAPIYHASIIVILNLVSKYLTINVSSNAVYDVVIDSSGSRIKALNSIF